MKNAHINKYDTVLLTLKTCFIDIGIYLFMTHDYQLRGNIHLRFSRNSEANASELIENIEYY